MNRLPRLKSAFAQQLLSPDILTLLEQTGLAIGPQTIIGLATAIQDDLVVGYDQLSEIDSRIGGVGLHNINRPDGEWLTGNYRLEFRPLFRPIQYVYGAISQNDLTWEARHIIQWSCGHVEDAVKFRFNIPRTFYASLGVLLTRRPEIKNELEPKLFEWLLTLNRAVYRGAKHAVEELEIDAHRFAPADALAVYLMCRCAGVQLLDQTGLFNDWKATQ